ncbi:MAG TPA: S41 family peptidase [Candidatus Tectomicrobia bacterium]
MRTVLHQRRRFWASWKRVLALVCVLTGGCAGSLVSDPAKAALLRHLHETYLFDVEVADLARLSVPEIVGHLDADTHLVARQRPSHDAMRGFEPEGSVVAVRELGGGRGYLHLTFFGRRTLADVRKVLNSFTPPLCALTIDLRDNTGGSFEAALDLAALFLPSGVPLAMYEDRAGRALLYATQEAPPRQERLTIVINAGTVSSAELFAGVLQWHRRAVLSGAPTAGKRTVQRVVQLDHHHLLFLTTGRFLAPDGSLFGAHGLTPDHPATEDNTHSVLTPCAGEPPPSSRSERAGPATSPGATHAWQ